MKISCFGAGYVGLVSSACLADAGHHAMCVDTDVARIKSLQDGILPIYESGLDAIVENTTQSGYLQFSADAAQAVDFADVIFIAVGTPPDEDGSADLQYVLAVATEVGRRMTRDKTIVTKSTVPVGTSDKVRAAAQAALDARGSALKVLIASNPEFLKEGAAVGDFMKPDRIVVGTDSDAVKSVMLDLYAPFNRNSDRMIFMDIRSAELTKYAANAMLATKISFMNEIANLAEILGADIEHVRHGIGSDPRIGYQFIYPGIGYGGSCFPKDVRALSQTAAQLGREMRILNAVEAVNTAQKSRLVELVQGHYATVGAGLPANLPVGAGLPANNSLASKLPQPANSSLASKLLQGKTFALWGLSFKPKTDDMREAPSRVIMEALWAAGARVQAYDPEAMQEVERIYGHRDDLRLVGTRDAALAGADALIICTEWQHFRAADFEHLAQALRDKVIFDGRNMYDPAKVAARGLTYYAIGRGASVQRG